MRHRKVKKVLDRKSGPRKALLRGLSTNLIVYGKIRTTKARARVIRPTVERLITRAKRGTLADRRALLSYVYTEQSVQKLLEVIAPRYATRTGGYTRISPIGTRGGDGAEMVQIEFV